MKKLNLLALLALITMNVTGQEQSGDTLALSLNEAVEIAKNNNTKMQNARLDVKSSKKKVWETTAIGLPHVDGELNYQHIPGDLPTVNFGGTNPQMTQFYSYVFDQFDALGQPVPPELESALTTPSE